MKSAGAFPTNTCDRMLVLGAGNPDIDHLGPRGFEYRPCLFDFNLRSKSSLISILIQLECLLVLRDRVLQQLFFGIQTSRREVIDSQGGMHAQVYDRQISGTGLGLLSIRLYVPAHSAPGIDLVREINGQSKITKR